MWDSAWLCPVADTSLALVAGLPLQEKRALGDPLKALGVELVAQVAKSGVRQFQEALPQFSAAALFYLGTVAW